MKPILPLILLLGAPAPAASGQEAGWSIDAPVAKIPKAKLRGQIFGRTLAEYTATFGDHGITLQSKERVGGWPASEVLIFVGKDERGKEIVVTPKSDGQVPHIHMKTGIEGRSFPGTLMYVGMYSMRLVTREAGDGRLECAIHLSLPDHHKSHLIGTFTATSR